MKPMTIEGLLRWAAVDEWPKAKDMGLGPKAPAAGWASVASYVELLTVVDDNAYGVVPDVWGHGEPHPDAVVLAEAVGTLVERDGDGRAISVVMEPIDPELLIGDLVWRVAERQGDDAALAAWAWLAPRVARAIADVVVVDRDGAMRSRDPLDALVVRCAILGGPSWRAAPTTWAQALHANGTPIWRRRLRQAQDWDDAGDVTRWGEVEVDAPRINGRRPVDAYPAMALSPWDANLLAERVRHIVWLSALRAVAALVAGRLQAHEIADADMSVPWMEAASGGRVLADLAPRAATGRAGEGGHARWPRKNRGNA